MVMPFLKPVLQQSEFFFHIEEKFEQWRYNNIRE